MVLVTVEVKDIQRKTFKHSIMKIRVNKLCFQGFKVSKLLHHADFASPNSSALTS